MTSPAGPRSAPPELPGFSWVRWLGGGGFADVFEYEQARPARRVAVKVLRAVPMTQDERRRFDDEADLMARVSAHPYIVSIFDTGTAADGRPYLVLEYYSQPHLGRQARDRRLPLAEVLRHGVHLASAVETAHGAGVLHRDIKPANVLVNAYGRPGLTDFGMSRAVETSGSVEGVSIPYAPPEVLLDRAPDVRSDVYSLAATVFTLLSGRSPFEDPEMPHDRTALLHRVLEQPARPTGRPDVPAGLENLLLQALAKDPAQRPQTALAFARELQSVERGLELAVTDLALVLEERPGTAGSDEEDDRTRIGSVAVVSPAGPHSAVRSLAPDGEHDTELDAVASPVPPPAPPAAAPRSVSLRTLATGAGIAALAAAVVAVIVLFVPGGEVVDPDEEEAAPDPDALVLVDAPEPPAQVALVREGGVVEVTWSAPAAQAGDTYLVERTDEAGSDEAPVSAEVRSARLAAEAGERPCVTITVVRDGRLSSPSRTTCLR